MDFSYFRGQGGSHTNNLNFDIDLDESLTERVDLDKTGIDGLVEFSELGDQTNISLVHLLVRVRATYDAGKGSKSARAGTKSIYYIKINDIFLS